jgi:hypothetical protein
VLKGTPACAPATKSPWKEDLQGAANEIAEHVRAAWGLLYYTSIDERDVSESIRDYVVGDI